MLCRDCEEKKRKRKCPSCNSIITYRRIIDCIKAEQNKKLCKSCEKKIIFKRNCPNCNKEIIYKKKENYENAIKNNTLCFSCAGLQKQYKLPQELKQQNKEKGLPAKMNSRIFLAWVKRYGEEKANEMWEERYKKHSEKISGERNYMYKKTVKEIWNEKYDKEKVKEKEQEWKNKISKSVSGENNPMYGKPAPNGSGNGWKGWYKGIYFASLREFYYLKYLIDNNIKFENGEKRKYKIEYEFMGKKCNYFLDFYLPESDTYIEIKPKNLINNPKNSAKFKAAKEKLGNKFKVLTEDDLIKIDLETIYNLYLNKELVFLEKYEEKFLKYYNKYRKEE